MLSVWVFSGQNQVLELGVVRRLRKEPVTVHEAVCRSSPVEGSESRRFYAVLQTDVIDAPAEAVQAAIVGDQRAQA